MMSDRNKILQLYFDEKLNQTEIAKILNISYPTAIRDKEKLVKENRI